MNRAMFSGVAGMKTHQTRMDVIGNNIANVNTYGYKSQRAVFSDIFYQTLMGASQGTASRGGRNPSTIGYGSTLASIQTMMSQSSMQSTGFGLDVAITGEGFLQVMDPDGNIFYTKAGLLDYDANGYLVDINGNFVLGSTDVNGAPNTQKIKLDNAGAVSPASPSGSQKTQGITYTLTASNNTKEGNVGVTITSGDLPIGQKASAIITETGSIIVQLNAGEVFATLSELNAEINKAIVLANNNQPHTGGTFTLAMTDENGADASSKFSSSTTPAASSNLTGVNFFGTAQIIGVSPNFAGHGSLAFSGRYTAGGDLVVTAAATNGKTFSATITQAQLANAGTYTLTGAAGDGNLTMSLPSLTTLLTDLGGITEAALAANINTYLSGALPGNTVTAGTTTGGLTGEQIAVNNFDVIPGKITGFPAAGFNFKETSNDFAGSGAVTAFGLTFDDSSGAGAWLVSMTIGGVAYSGTVPETAAGSSLMLKGPAGDSFTLTIPRYVDMNALNDTVNGHTPPVMGDSVDLMANGNPPYTGGTATTAIPSSNLGLSSVGFNLTGGTVGGLITLDQLSSINIGADGTVSVSHPDKGTMSVGKVSLANFANPRGLIQSGTNYFSETINSGKPVLCDPGSGGTGDLKANALEMSNVDLAQEFADMIVTQRGFQANTRIISVSDQMLEELVNLKR